MITEPIVLILGAGASVPYGFPTGEQLSRWVKGIIDPEDPVPQTAFDETVRLLQEMEYDDEERKRFVYTLSRSAQSVDAFLEYNPEFMGIGKAFMACFLIRCEQEGKLCGGEREWYHYLLDRMRASPQMFHENMISIVTFNYDRSLEHFLFMALLHSYGLTEEDAASMVRSIQIVHVHGQLGHLPWQSRAIQNEHVRPYVAEPTPESVKVAANGIKIISQAKESSPEFVRVHGLLQNAHQVHFLGFGYDKQNMRRLKIPRPGEAHPWLKACTKGTCYKLTRNEANQITAAYCPLKLPDPAHKVLDHLRNDEDFLRACS